MYQSSAPVSHGEQPLQAPPELYKEPPPSYYRAAPPAWTPRPKKTTEDWLGLIPSYHRFLFAKLCLAAAAGAVAIAVIVLTKVFSDRLSVYRSPNAFLYSDSITYGSATLAIIWSLFEFMVMFLFTPRNAPRRGIHPGGHLLFHMTIWILTLYSIIENVNYLKARARRRDHLFLPGTPQSAKDEIAHLQKALLGTLVALVVIEFLLFCRACWETLQVNSGKHAAPTIELGAVATQRLGSQRAVTAATGPGPSWPPPVAAPVGARPYKPLPE